MAQSAHPEQRAQPALPAKPATSQPAVQGRSRSRRVFPRWFLSWRSPAQPTGGCRASPAWLPCPVIERDVEHTHVLSSGSTTDCRGGCHVEHGHAPRLPRAKAPLSPLGTPGPGPRAEARRNTSLVPGDVPPQPHHWSLGMSPPSYTAHPPGCPPRATAPLLPGCPAGAGRVPGSGSSAGGSRRGWGGGSRVPAPSPSPSPSRLPLRWPSGSRARPG